MYGWEGIAQGGGLTLMMVGMVVVFSALVLLMFLMKGLKRYQEYVHNSILRREQKKAAALEASSQPIDLADAEDIPGVVAAAIAMTLLFEQEQVHDEESLVLTLRKMQKPYSIWWQNKIEPNWSPAITRSQVRALQTVDPVRGKAV
jgi:glutaconyl-CoA/methylmalonyl-CoA decarboxylase subunit delta